MIFECSTSEISCKDGMVMMLFLSEFCDFRGAIKKKVEEVTSFCENAQPWHFLGNFIPSFCKSSTRAGWKLHWNLRNLSVPHQAFTASVFSYSLVNTRKAEILPKIVHYIEYLLSTSRIWFGPFDSSPKYQNIPVQREAFCIHSLWYPQESSGRSEG